MQFLLSPHLLKATSCTTNTLYEFLHSFFSTSNFFYIIKKLGVENPTQKKQKETKQKNTTTKNHSPSKQKPRGKIYDLVCDEQTEQ